MEKKLTKKQILISILKTTLNTYTNATSIERKWLYNKLKMSQMEELINIIRIHCDLSRNKYKYINIYKNRSGLLDKIEISDTKNKRLSIAFELKD